MQNETNGRRRRSRRNGKKQFSYIVFNVDINIGFNHFCNFLALLLCSRPLPPLYTFHFSDFFCVRFTRGVRCLSSLMSFGAFVCNVFQCSFQLLTQPSACHCRLDDFQRLNSVSSTRNTVRWCVCVCVSESLQCNAMHTTKSHVTDVVGARFPL